MIEAVNIGVIGSSPRILEANHVHGVGSGGDEDDLHDTVVHTVEVGEL